MIQVLDVEKYLSSTLCPYNWDGSRPYQLPHAPFGPAKVLRRLFQSVEALGQGNTIRVYLFNWLILLWF